MRQTRRKREKLCRIYSFLRDREIVVRVSYRAAENVIRLVKLEPLDL